MAQAVNAYVCGAEAGGSEVQCHSRQLQSQLRLRETLCLKKKKIKKEEGREVAQQVRLLTVKVLV